MKDSIDFATMNVTTLFRKLLVPTLLGMIFSAVFIITDGIFVGKGIGSDALAAVNITAPLFLINTGVALMFGIGASVVASIHLSQGKVKVARINITQQSWCLHCYYWGMPVLLCLRLSKLHIGWAVQKDFCHWLWSICVGLFLFYLLAPCLVPDSFLFVWTVLPIMP